MLSIIDEICGNINKKNSYIYLRQSYLILIHTNLINIVMFLKKKKKVFISKVHNKISLKFSNHAYNLQNYFVKIILLTVLKKFNLLLKIKLTFHLLRRFICVNLKSVFNFIL